MQKSRQAREQHIAVFGESGSGKTVLLSSFYGATQEPQYRKTSLFDVTADDIGQGSRLYRNYLGMRDSAQPPVPTRFSAKTYSFSVKLRDVSDPKAMKKRPFDALRLVWHDYPGEWFEQDVSGPEEAQRRLNTFRSLLTSDVAFLLVDGQRLLDNAGEEERYLKSLLTNFRNGLMSLKDDLLIDGKPLIQFPRIWMMALSKSDLIPDMNVFNFMDLVLAKAGDEMDELRDVLESFVQAPEALSVGEDFILLSSAKFEVDKIEVDERVGLELVLPVAAIVPFERHTRWSQAEHIPRKVAENLLDGTADIAAALIGLKLPGRIGILVNLFAPKLNDALSPAADALKDNNAEALVKKEYLRATLTRFRMDLEKGEEEEVLLRSRR